MFQIIARVKEKVLEKKLDKVLKEAQHLKTQGFLKLYNLKMSQASAVVKQIASLKKENKSHSTPASIDTFYTKSNFYYKSVKKTAISS